MVAIVASINQRGTVPHGIEADNGKGPYMFTHLHSTLKSKYISFIEAVERIGRVVILDRELIGGRLFLLMDSASPLKLGKFVQVIDASAPENADNYRTSSPREMAAITPAELERLQAMPLRFLDHLKGTHNKQLRAAVRRWHGLNGIIVDTREFDGVDWDLMPSINDLLTAVLSEAGRQFEARTGGAVGWYVLEGFRRGWNGGAGAWYQKDPSNFYLTCDAMKIEMIDGAIEVTTYDHDGTNRVTLKIMPASVADRIEESWGTHPTAVKNGARSWLEARKPWRATQAGARALWAVDLY